MPPGLSPAVYANIFKHPPNETPTQKAELEHQVTRGSPWGGRRPTGDAGQSMGGKKADW